MLHASLLHCSYWLKRLQGSAEWTSSCLNSHLDDPSSTSPMLTCAWVFLHVWWLFQVLSEILTSFTGLQIKSQIAAFSVRDFWLRLTQMMMFVEYIREPWLQELPLTHPYPTPAVPPWGRGERREMPYRLGKGVAEVGRLGKTLWWSAGGQEEERARAVPCGGTLPLSSVSWSPLSLTDRGRDAQPPA